MTGRRDCPLWATLGPEGMELSLGTGKGRDPQAGGSWGSVGLGSGGESLCHPSLEHTRAVGWAAGGHRARGPGQHLAVCGVPG